MRGYYRDELEDYDSYEDDGEEEDEEEEEDPKPTKEELDYLELRQKLKDAKRKQMKRENGSLQSNRLETKNKPPNDNFGSFFGPAKPVIAQRVIQESKSFIENRHLAAKLSNSQTQHTIKKSSTSATAGSKAGVRTPMPKVVNQLKVRDQKLRDNRDYSFLLSDDAEHPAPAKQSSVRNCPPSTSETRYTQGPPKSKQPLGNGERHVNGSHEQRKPMNGQIPPKFESSKPTSASKSSSASMDPRKQLGSKNGVSSVRPLGTKTMPNVSLQKKTPVPGSNSSLPALHKQPSSKLQSSDPKQQQLEQRKQQYQHLEHRKQQQLPDQRRLQQHPEQRRPQQHTDHRRPPPNPDHRRPPQNPEQRRPPQNPDQRRPPQNPDQRRPPQNPDQRRPPQNPDSRRPLQNPDSRRPLQNPEPRRLLQNPDPRRLPQNPDPRRPQQHQEQKRPQQHQEQKRPQDQRRPQQPPDQRKQQLHQDQRRPQQHLDQRRPQQHQDQRKLQQYSDQRKLQQHPEQRKERQEPNQSRMAPKHSAVSSRPQINKPPKPNPSRTMEDRRPKKKPARYFSDDDDDDGGAIAMIRKMFRYNPNKYAGRDEDDSDMEANFDDILREEKRSAKIARREDEEQLRLIEQEEEQERRAALARKKRKLSQR